MKAVFITVAAASSAMLLTPTASLAKVVDYDQVRGTVSTRDINLNTEAGRETLQRRVNAKIQRMCSDSARRDRAAQMAVRDCVAKARMG